MSKPMPSSLTPAEQEHESLAPPQKSSPQKEKRGFTFWMVILAVNVSAFLALLDTTIISNALPTIVLDLEGGSDFIWVGAAYSLSAAAVMPLSGALAQIFGRKAVMLTVLILFALGSAVSGAAHSMHMLIAGRAIQGIGGAGLLSCSAIIISDVVPLAERGAFNGLLQLTWCLATGLGPIVSGKLAQDGQWRWIFYLNLPICLVAWLLVLFFLHLKVPQRTLQENIEILDITGNFLLIAGSCSFGIGLIWGGTTFPWHSARVLVPIIVGAVGLIATIVYEYAWSPRPSMPIRLMNNRTVFSGYMQILIVPLSLFAVICALPVFCFPCPPTDRRVLQDYLPIYLQACKGSSPTRSGVELLALALSLAPIALVSGITVTITKRYRVQLWFGWIFMIVALVLLGTIKVDTSIAHIIGFQILLGFGYGIVLSATYFPVLAPLPVTSISQALSFFAFLRQFTQVWGIAVGGVILQNELNKHIPSNFLGNFSSAEAISIIPLLEVNLSPGDLEIVRTALAESLSKLWQIMAGIMGAGLLVSLAMEHYTLHTAVDKDYDIARKEENVVEKIQMTSIDSERGQHVDKRPEHL